MLVLVALALNDFYNGQSDSVLSVLMCRALLVYRMCFMGDPVSFLQGLDDRRKFFCCMSLHKVSEFLQYTAVQLCEVNH